MDFENKIPEWKNEGTEPSEELRTKGFEAKYKPPAAFFNWFWSKVIKAINEIQNKFKSHAEDTNNPHGVTKKQLGLDNVDNVKQVPMSFYSVQAASSDGVAYTATIEGLTRLYAGLVITIVPNMTSTSKNVTLNVNNFGARGVYMSSPAQTQLQRPPSQDNWLSRGKAVQLIYSGTTWMTSLTASNASDISGTLVIEKGGTGATTATKARENIGLGNVDNTSDTNKPVSTAQATAIADAKKAGTDAQTNLNAHKNDKNNPHGVTAEQAGALPIDGSQSTTGANLYTNNKKGRIYTGANNLSIHHHKNGEESQDKDTRFIEIYSDNTAIEYAFKVGQYTNGALKIYNLHGEHNKPSGSYTGNAKDRTINVGGIGNVLLIKGSSGAVLVHEGGAFGNYGRDTEAGSNTTFRSFDTRDVTYSDGVLTIKSTHTLLNSNGNSYKYQVL